MDDAQLKLSDRLAIDRTALAADRTLMAWVRTSFSMIGFGFTIYKFLHGAVEKGVAARMRPQGPRNLGLALVCLGTVSLIVASIHYLKFKRKLTPDKKVSPWDLTLIVALLVALLGLFVTASIVLNIGPF